MKKGLWEGALELERLCKPLKTLKPDPKNARKHNKKNLDALAYSLKTFGQQKPIVACKGVVIAGNGTFEVAKGLGWTRLAVVDFKDSKQARAYAIADNRTAELAEWDMKILEEALVEIKDIESLGFTLADMKDLNLGGEKEPPMSPFR